MFDKLLSGSWKTTAVGVAEGLVLWVIEELRNGAAVPSDTVGWLLWFSGGLRIVSGLVQKDFNKTNAVHVTETPKTLPLIATPQEPMTP